MWRAWGVLALVLAGTLAACGSSGEQNTTAGTPPGSIDSSRSATATSGPPEGWIDPGTSIPNDEARARPGPGRCRPPRRRPGRDEQGLGVTTAPRLCGSRPKVHLATRTTCSSQPGRALTSAPHPHCGSESTRRRQGSRAASASPPRSAIDGAQPSAAERALNSARLSTD